MTRIAVIGSGNIGATIGEAWRRAGHEVTFASRSPEPPRTVAFADPSIGGEVADLFWCGPDDAGVEQLIADVGLRPVRVGGIDAIDVVDGACRLWLTLVFRQGHPRRLAFRMLGD